MGGTAGGGLWAALPPIYGGSPAPVVPLAYRVCMKSAVALALSLAIAGGAGYYILASESDDSAQAEDSRAKRNRRSKSRDGQDGETPEPGGSSSGDEELERRVARLEKRVRQLEGQVRMGAMRADGSPGPLDLQDPESNAQIHEVVEGALADAREAERAEREERRQQWMDSRREEALAALVEQAGIAAEKSQQIGELWKTEQEQLGDLFQRARDGELDFRAARDQAEAIRSATDAAAYEGMSDDQRTTYDENRPGPPGRGGRGGGGGRQGR